MRKSAPTNPHGFHSSLLYLPFKSKQRCSLSHRNTQLNYRLIKATPALFVNSHYKSYRFYYALRHRLERGAKYGTILNLHE